MKTAPPASTYLCSTLRVVDVTLADDEVERSILVKLPQLAPGAEAGEKAGGGAGGAGDHKQQFWRQNGNDNI